MSAASRIVTFGGTVFVASECSDGIPEHGNFGAMLKEAKSPEAIDAMLKQLPEPKLDQWQAQVLAAVLKHCEVSLHSSLDTAIVRECLMTPIDQLQKAVELRIGELGAGLPVAVLPEGPITIPYLAQ